MKLFILYNLVALSIIALGSWLMGDADRIAERLVFSVAGILIAILAALYNRKGNP